MSTTSPAGDEVQLVAEHVRATAAHLERRIEARFGDRGITRAARDLGQLVELVRTQALASHVRLRRTTLVSRAVSATIVVATVFAIGLTLTDAVTEGLDHGFEWLPLIDSTISNLVFAGFAVLFLWAFPERLERRRLLRLLHRLRSLAHVIDMHQLSKDPEQVSPTYQRTQASVMHGLNAEQLHHYYAYCSELLSLTAKTAALCAEHSSDSIILETVSTLETLTTELSNKIWQKISLLPRPETAR